MSLCSCELFMVDHRLTSVHHSHAPLWHIVAGTIFCFAVALDSCSVPCPVCVQTPVRPVDSAGLPVFTDCRFLCGSSSNLRRLRKKNESCTVPECGDISKCGLTPPPFENLPRQVLCQGVTEHQPQVLKCLHRLRDCLWTSWLLDGVSGHQNLLASLENVLGSS